MLDQSFEVPLNELWQSVRKINVMRSLWGLPSIKRTIMRVLPIMEKLCSTVLHTIPRSVLHVAHLHTILTKATWQQQWWEHTQFCPHNPNKVRRIKTRKQQLSKGPAACSLLSGAQ